MFWKTSPNSDNWSLAVVDRTTVTEVLPLNCGVDVPDLLPEPQPDYSVALPRPEGSAGTVGCPDDSSGVAAEPEAESSLRRIGSLRMLCLFS